MEFEIVPLCDKCNMGPREYYVPIFDKMICEKCMLKNDIKEMEKIIKMGLLTHG